MGGLHFGSHLTAIQASNSHSERPTYPSAGLVVYS
jgi:hypothetical protein